VNMNKAIYRKCSSKVKAMGNQVAQLTSMSGQNDISANMPAGVQIVPSQTNVLVMP